MKSLVILFVLVSISSGPACAGKVPGALQNFVSEESRIILHYLENGLFDELREYIEKGGNINESGIDGSTLLVWAIYADDLDAASILVELGADPKLPEGSIRSALCISPQLEEKKFLNLFLNSGESANYLLCSGLSLFTLAIRKNRIENIKLLMQKGGDPVMDRKSTDDVLLSAVAHKNYEILLFLLESAPSSRKEEVLRSLERTYIKPDNPNFESFKKALHFLDGDMGRVKEYMAKEEERKKKYDLYWGKNTTNEDSEVGDPKGVKKIYIKPGDPNYKSLKIIMDALDRQELGREQLGTP